MTTTLTTPLASTGRAWVHESLFDRLATRIVRDHELPRSMAERIMDQAIAFLVASAANPLEQLAPSELVDIGWHTFILHTRDYREFCLRITHGSFIDHVPTEDGDPRGRGEQARSTLTRTLCAILDCGLAIDGELWPTVTGQCSQCHQGCTDSP